MVIVYLEVVNELNTCTCYGVNLFVESTLGVAAEDQVISDYIGIAKHGHRYIVYLSVGEVMAIWTIRMIDRYYEAVFFAKVLFLLNEFIVFFWVHHFGILGYRIGL